MTTLTTRGVGGVLQLSGQPDLPVMVLLRHSTQDASALRAVVLLDDDESVELVLDRALVTAGLIGRAHDGDVQVGVQGDLATFVVADLTLGLRLADVVELLLATYAASATGSERDVVIALDARARELSQT